MLKSPSMIDEALAEIILPPAPYSQDGYWSRKKTAEYLSLNRETLQFYLDELCTAIPDFRRDIHRNPATGEYLKGFKLSPYQLWVAIRVTALMRVLRRYLNGRAYLKDTRKIVFQYRDHFSRKIFLEHQQHESDLKQISQVA